MGRFRRIVKSKHSAAETVCCCRGKRVEIWGDDEEYNFLVERVKRTIFGNRQVKVIFC